MTDTQSIAVSLWDSGCLPELLKREIAAVDRRVRAIGSQLSESDRQMYGAYRGQLAACLEAVEKARVGQ